MAQDSRQLQSNLALDEFFGNIERECFKRADALPLADEKGRDRAYFILHLSRKFKAALGYYVQDGELSERQLADLIGPERPEKRGFLGGLFNG